MSFKLRCLIFDHKKYCPDALGGKDFMTINDCLGGTLVKINVCERCGKLYTDWERWK